MAQNHSLRLLVAAMDGLWFHQVILFSNPMSLLCPTTLRIAPQTTSSSDSLMYSSSNLSTLPPPEEETSAHPSASPLPQLVDDEDDPKNEGEDKEMKQKERPTRLNLMISKTRSLSSSPATKKLAKNHRYLGAVTRSLSKTMSCKSLRELELEEVKGFMDLGFKFKRDRLSPRMVTVIPGLQRLGGYNNEQKNELSDSTQSANYKDDEIEEGEEEEEERAIVRPYLSEAWLIKRPDSPLLNLKMPTVVSSSADMKKHLCHWARTVAYVIQQES